MPESALRTIKTIFSGDSKELIAAAAEGEAAVEGWSKGMAKAFNFALAASVGIVGGLAVLGEQFDKAFDDIRIGTGATGDELESLHETFKKALVDLPDSMAVVSDALTQIYQRTGLTGDALQALTEQEVKLANITKSDLGTQIAATTRIFGDWSISTAKQEDALNALFRAGQATGITVSDLSQTVVQFGAPLRQLGFSFDESITLLAKWEKEGVNTDLVLGGLKKALGQFAKAGKDPVKALEALETSIKNATSTANANKIAVTALGVKVGPDFAAAVREGRFSYEDLLKTVSDGTDTIDKAEEQTDSFGERMTKLKNKAFVALQPAAEQVFDVFEKIADKLEVVGDWMDKHQGTVANFVKGILAFATAMLALKVTLSTVSLVLAVLNPLLAIFDIELEANPIGLIVIAIALLVAGLILAYNKVGWFRTAVNATWAAIKVGAEAIGKAAVWLWKDVIVPAFNGIVAAVHWVATAATWLWTTVLKPTFDAISSAAKFAFGIFMWIGANIFVPFVNIAEHVFASIMNFVTSLANLIIWLDVQIFTPVFKAIAAVANWLWTTVLKPIWDQFVGALNVVGAVANWLWGILVQAFNGFMISLGIVWNFVKPIFEQIISIINTIAGVVSRVFGAIAGIIGSAFHDAVNIVKGVINTLIDIINGAIKLINNNVIHTLNKVPGVTFGDIPSLPRLALGGRAAAGRNYLVGENGPEILSMGGRSGHVTSNGDAFGGGMLYLTLDLGEGISQVFQVKIDKDKKATARKVGAGAGAR